VLQTLAFLALPLGLARCPCPELVRLPAGLLLGPLPLLVVLGARLAEGVELGLRRRAPRAGAGHVVPRLAECRVELGAAAGGAAPGVEHPRRTERQRDEGQQRRARHRRARGQRRDEHHRGQGPGADRDAPFQAFWIASVHGVS
jgi:hypothetical protein